MIITTTEIIPGKQYDVVGLARGSIVQSKNFVKDFMAELKSAFGGELKPYTEMMSEARALATKRMVEDAQDQGAHAVVCMRYSSATITSQAAEVIAYGTAVRFRNLQS